MSHTHSHAHTQNEPEGWERDTGSETGNKKDNGGEKEKRIQRWRERWEGESRPLSEGHKDRERGHWGGGGG